MEHSKGPWTTDIGYGPTNQFVDYIVADDGRVIAETIELNSPDQNRADAYLIAAAPELLESCKELIATLELYGAGSFEFFESRNSMLAVIAKAKGRS